jgi:hypothetical protein
VKEIYSDDLKERDREDANFEGSIILKQILKKQDRSVWTGLFWLKEGTSNGLL